VLNIGLQAGILSVPLFTIMVIMALFTTFVTVGRHRHHHTAGGGQDDNEGDDA
jgi:hypothetical protein